MSNRKRRKLSAEFKAEIVLSEMTGEKSQATIDRRVTMSLVYMLVSKVWLGNV